MASGALLCEQSPATSARIEQRGVAGHQQHALVAGGERVADPDRRRLRLALLLGVAQHLNPLAEGGGLGHAVGGDDDHGIEALDVAQRAEHVGEHRLGERLARARAEQTGETLLRRGEALDRKDGDRSHEARREGCSVATSSGGVPVPPAASAA